VTVALDHIEDESLLEFLDRFLEENSLANHLIDQFFQFRSHDTPLGRALCASRLRLVDL
jgi:hypothetical protein